MLPDQPDLLDELLRGIARDLDIPLEMFLEADRRYRHLATWLSDECGIDLAIEIYPQGSMRLGTVVRPDLSIEQYDLDMVFLIHVSKQDLTKQELRDLVGELLAEYIQNEGDKLPCMPKLEERGRCWTLDFHPLGFHLDVLPAIPHDDGAKNAIAITDRDLHLWQYSNPIAYSDWFLAKVPASVFEDSLARMAKRLDRSIEQVPHFMVRTPLQRLTQIVKRHRDVYFSEDPDMKPPSVLLTTLIAQSYRGGTDLQGAANDFIASVPDLIHYEDGRWVVHNPVEKEENFADKWNTNPDRREAFLAWAEQLKTDLASASNARGLHKVATILNSGFGETPVRKATAALGASLTTAGLSIESSGRLTTEPTDRRIPEHTFHGPHQSSS